MITPLDIQEKQFSKGLKGFKEDEVNEFLDEITLDLERLLEEERQMRATIEALQEENQQLKEEMKKVQESQHSVIDTLETAKALMSDISASAEKRAQILMKNAEMEAQTMIRTAKEAVARMNEENAQIKNKLTGFRKKYKEMLERELKQFEDSTADLYEELSIDDLSELPDVSPTKNTTKETAAYSKDTLTKTMVHKK